MALWQNEQTRNKLVEIEKKYDKNGDEDEYVQKRNKYN